MQSHIARALSLRFPALAISSAQERPAGAKDTQRLMQEIHST
jgi:hypothetical protein